MLSAVESRGERGNKSIKNTRVKNKRSDIQIVNYIIAFFSTEAALELAHYDGFQVLLF